MNKTNKKIFITSKEKAQAKVYLTDCMEDADILGVVVHNEDIADMGVYITGRGEADYNLYIVRNSRRSKNEGL